jgi:hypothetical protein
MKLDMYIIAPESISTEVFINSSHQCMYTSLAARQRLGKNVTAAIDTHATIDEFLVVVFYVVSVLGK